MLGASGGYMELWIGAVVIWFICAWIAVDIAENKGLSGSTWGCVGFLFGPLGLVLALVQKPDTAKIEDQALTSGGMRKCPSCAELVRHEAVKCRYCGELLPTRESVPLSSGGISRDLFPNPHSSGRFNCAGCNRGRPMEGAARIGGKIYCAECAAARQ
jgi:hypothetical protein